MELKFKVQTKISKPVEEVFDAVYNPKKLSGYFTNGGASAPLDEGTTVQWTFADAPGKEVTVPVKVQRMERNRLIQFQWSASEGIYDPKTGEYPTPAPYSNTVEMTFESLGKNQTLLSIVEGTWRSTPGGLNGSYQNCQGWTQMSSCLKAYLEYGIDLRKGAF